MWFGDIVIPPPIWIDYSLHLLALNKVPPPPGKWLTPTMFAALVLSCPFIIVGARPFVVFGIAILIMFQVDYSTKRIMPPSD